MKIYSRQDSLAVVLILAVLAPVCVDRGALIAAEPDAAAATAPASGPAVLGAAGRPALGVYRTVGEKGTQGVDNFAHWLGVPVRLGHDSMPTNATWDHISGQNLEWLLIPWSKWKKAAASRHFVLSVSILAGPWDLSGPKIGTDANKPVSHEAGARGEYNHHFKSLAEQLVQAGLQDSLLRLGWEMNGGWYPWRAAGHEEAFAGYWRQIVTTMRSVPGAENLRFVFNPDCDPGWCKIEKAWPGDEFVDYVGIDIYDCSWLPGTYPIPTDATPQEALARQQKVWTELHLHGNNNHRLLYWRDFAKQHHKPLCFPEWGVCGRQVNDHGGGDDPYFVEQMYKFIMDPANNVVFHSYFDCTNPNDKNTDHRISPEPDGSFTTHFPRSAAKYKELFGVPVR
jgi:hypothetical protein